MSKKSGSENFASTEFVGRLKAREPHAIEAIVRQYTEQIYRAALGLGFDANGAQELSQSVWVTFFDVIQGFQGKAHIRTFVFGILYNKALELRREQSKADPTDDIEAVMDSRFDESGEWIKPPLSAEEFVHSSQLMAFVEKCLEHLATNQKLAFMLKEVHEEDTPDICSILNVSVTNLGVLLFRAKNRLRECVEMKLKNRTQDGT